MVDYLNLNYKNKIESCVSALKEFETSRTDLESKYKNSFFDNSDIDKLTTFLNLLNFKKIEPETIHYLNTKCDHLKHFKDKRRGFEYAVDLILGWLVEDGVSFFLNKNNVLTSLNGSDSTREFLTKFQISTDADLSINSNTSANLEVFCDWSNTWKRYNHADFRDQKFQKLKKTKSWVLGISPKISKGFLLDVKLHSHLFERSESIKGYGGKPGFTVNGIKDHLLPLSEVKENLISIF